MLLLNTEREIVAALSEKLPDNVPVEFDEEAIPCDLQIAVFFQNKITPAKQCADPATWYGFYPCCGRVVLVCDVHFKDENPFYCSLCKRQHKTLSNWTRL